MFASGKAETLLTVAVRSLEAEPVSVHVSLSNQTCFRFAWILTAIEDPSN